jgi:pilus assembly protein CpaB
VKGKLLTMIGIAGVFGAISIFAADMWLKSAAQARVEPVIVAAAPLPAEPAIAFRTIVVAREPLRFGAELSEAQLAEIPWAEDSLPEGATETISALMSAGGRVVLSPIAANEPVLLAKLSGPGGRATLSNLLSPGMRAVTIRVDEIAGVAGFVTPGDRVDVVLTRDAGEVLEVQGSASGAAGSTIATEVVVQNAKVLSVGQDLDERSTAPQVAASVTLEVSPGDAGKVALARNVGTLSLALRSAGEGGALAGGLTTIRSFGGSVGEDEPEPQPQERSIFAMEPEKKTKTVVVTRGMKAETYQVPAPQN